MELIKIQNAVIGESEVNAVEARELHSFLEVRTSFNDWIKKRISEYEFANDSDYLKISNPNYKGIGIAPVNYVISLEMAKELAMVERNEKGKEARKYFIECEKKLKAIQYAIPKTYSEALLLAAEQTKKIEEQNEIIKDQAPKVEFYDSVMESEDTLTFAEAAKILNMKHPQYSRPIGQNKLFYYCKEKGMLLPSREPYQKYVAYGYFKVVELRYETKDLIRINRKTVILQKGLDYIRKKLEKDGYKQVL